MGRKEILPLYLVKRHSTVVTTFIRRYIRPQRRKYRNLLLFLMFSGIFLILRFTDPGSDDPSAPSAVSLGSLFSFFGLFGSGVATVPPAESDMYPVVQGGEDLDPSVQEKRDKVKEMMEHAWGGYVQWAWGQNELRPLSKQPYSGLLSDAPLGATIIDSLDTLYIMGMDDEYEKGREWIASHFKLDDYDVSLSIFETNIRLVGGLLSCYALTGDILFRDKAEMVAKKLLPAFETPTGIPVALVNMKTGQRDIDRHRGGSSILSEFGSFHLEFSYLSDITGDATFRTKVETLRDFLQAIEKPQGLYPNYLNPEDGTWGERHISLGALGDSFYEYLLKAWLQSGREDSVAKTMFIEAMDAVLKELLWTSPTGLMYFADMHDDRLDHTMGHLACYSGGLLGLASRTISGNRAFEYMEAAEGITHTCHESYDRSATKLGPEKFGFSGDQGLEGVVKYYILRPEVIESYFIMWRLTKEQKYRDWAWEAVQAIEANCRTPDGYSGITNVEIETSHKDDVQQSFFLAETLKYLYLIFSDDSLISLEEWVFNTEAHPLPIKNVNPFYRPNSAINP